jgi:hypothetical protein
MKRLRYIGPIKCLQNKTGYMTGFRSEQGHIRVRIQFDDMSLPLNLTHTLPDTPTFHITEVIHESGIVRRTWRRPDDRQCSPSLIR